MITITARDGSRTYIAPEHVTIIYPPGIDGRVKIELVTGTTLFVSKDFVSSIIKQIEGSNI